MTSDVVVLMYHGIYGSPSELKKMPLEEQPYAISADTFESHLELFQNLALPNLDFGSIAFSGNNISAKDEVILDVKPTLLLTFDDGHESFYQYALPLLKKYGRTALFFITPQLVETRSDFCSWQQIKALKAAGMSIGAHGNTHQFISDLQAQAAREELQLSKQALDTHLQQNTITMSFPGGRYQVRDLAFARQAGFLNCMSSDIGIASRDIATLLNPLLPTPRYAIRAKTSLSTLEKMVTAHRGFLKSQQLFAGFKKRLKSMLGNSGYHQVYRLLSRK